MSIRTRLALWYAGIMFVSLVAMGILSYHAFAPEPHTSGHGPGERPRPDDLDESDLREIFRIIFFLTHRDSFLHFDTYKFNFVSEFISNQSQCFSIKPLIDRHKKSK